MRHGILLRVSASTGLLLGCQEPFGLEPAEGPPGWSEVAYGVHWDLRDDTPAQADGNSILLADGVRVPSPEIPGDVGDLGQRRAVREIDGHIWLSYDEAIAHFDGSDWTVWRDPIRSEAQYSQVDGETAEEVWFVDHALPRRLCRMRANEVLCREGLGGTHILVHGGRLWLPQEQVGWYRRTIAVLPVDEFEAGSLETRSILLDEGAPPIDRLQAVAGRPEWALAMVFSGSVRDERPGEDRRPRLIGLSGTVLPIPVPPGVPGEGMQNALSAHSFDEGVVEIVTDERKRSSPGLFCFRCPMYTEYHHVHRYLFSDGRLELVGFFADQEEVGSAQLWRFGERSWISIPGGWLSPSSN